ncbi:MAG TPA: hypothetical protein VLN47_07930 [Clostridiaceae bacterium]|nr:hypothetical protein [Clostridiaceae bacterium]
MKKMRYSALILLALLLSPTLAVYGDIGPKPAITIEVVNIENPDYLLDLLVTEDIGPSVSQKADFEIEAYKDRPIYLYNEDGYFAAWLRFPLLFGDIQGAFTGPSTATHTFSYRAVPITYKIIIEQADGSLAVSRVIERRNMYQFLTYDMATGTVTEKRTLDLMDSRFLLTLLATIVVELLIFFSFYRKKELRKIPVVILANIVSFLMLSLIITMFVMDYRYSDYLVSLAWGETFVFLCEGLTYVLFFREKKKAVGYALTANAVTFLLTFLIF